MNEDNPCGLEHAYFYRQEMYNVKDWDTGEPIKLEYFCNMDEQCREYGCGYNGVAHDLEAYKWQQEQWANHAILGSVLLGLLAGVFFMWLFWAIRNMIKK